MPVVNRSALVGYSSEFMFDLVNDVQSYPEFLPWCKRSWVLESTESQLVAKVEVSKGAISHSFTTRNTNVRPQEIRLALVEGPFKYLEGVWRFLSLDDAASKVSLELNFEFSQKMAALAMGPVFSQAASTLVEAFCKRAKVIYG